MTEEPKNRINMEKGRQVYEQTLARFANSTALGKTTIRAVAKLLEVQPKLVYRWMAGLERPSSGRVDAWKQRLEVFLRTPKPALERPLCPARSGSLSRPLAVSKNPRGRARQPSPMRPPKSGP